MHFGLLCDYLRFLAGDLSHSRSVSRSVRPLYFYLGLRFQFQLVKNALSSVFRAAVLDEEYVSTYFLATSKGWCFSGFSYLA